MKKGFAGSRFGFFLSISLMFLFGNANLGSASSGQGSWECRPIGTGVDYCLLKVPPQGHSDARIHIVRIDPARARLRILLASEHGHKSRTPSIWCREFGLVAAINAGMYAQDYLTNVGYLKNGANIHNKRWVKSYKSVLAFDPLRLQSVPAVIFDLDDPEAINKITDYRVVIQNLRLMKGGGLNVWRKNEKRWSEAAVGMDAAGRILFIFCGVPKMMWEFNELIKSSGMNVTRMMHVEGGTVAGMSICSPELSLDFAGGYESGSKPGQGGNRQWAVPNVIGVQLK